jgi:predicted GNAT family acetyltransferase
MLSTTTCSNDPVTIALDIFLADERPDLADLYFAGQERSYKRHPGSLAAVLPGRTGADCFVLARGPDGQAHAGMRAHLRRPDEPLPVERALGALCPIGEAIARAPAPLVELCGTWVGPAFRGSGLAAAVTAAAIAAARALGARTIVGCCHQHVLPLYCRFGAEVDPALGVHPYPDERYQTCVFWADPNVCGEEQATVDAVVARFIRGEPLHYEPARTAA